jgi:Calcineurin-like phosphoesterase
MAILLVQLSDLHAQSANNSVDAKWQLLCENVVTQIDVEVTACIIAFCGDAAYSAKKEEFAHTGSLLKQLADFIRKQRPTVDVKVLTIPGNHDCDLTSEDSEARVALRRLVTDKMPAKSISNVLLKAQENYFDFAKEVSGGLPTLSAESPFYTYADIVVSDKLLRVHLINSAWTSILKETDDLRFPLDAFNPPAEPSADYTITMMHHPINWFLMPDVRRGLRDAIESQSELVLTGHEHEQEASRRQVEGGPELDYTEGGVLQESKKPSICTFNTIRFDFLKRCRRLCNFSWAGTFFDARDVGDQALESNPHRIDQKFALKPTFAKSLDEMEEPLTGPKGIELHLSHLFVYPDLRRYSDLRVHSKEERNTQVTQLIRSSDALTEVRRETRALIVGGEKSGKTSFAKVLFQELHRGHELPLLLNGKSFGRSGSLEGARRLLDRSVQEQYQRITSSEYFQQPKKLRVLILDDLQDWPDDQKAREQLLGLLSERFDRLLVFASDEFYVELVNDGKAEASGLLGFQRLDICDFGGLRLEELAERWVRLSRNEVNATDLKDTVVNLTEKVQQIIAISGLPHTPWLLIFTLEQAEGDSPAVKNGSYGHMYQAVLTVALSRTSFKQLDLAGKFTYLAELAYQFFLLDRATITQQEARAFHTAHCSKYDLVIDFERVTEDLIEARVLRLDGEELAFRYRYTFCFFVAWWLSRNLRKDLGTSTIKALSERLHHETSANILVFLAFLSDDPLIIEAMQAAARKLFGDMPAATLESEIQPLNDLKGVESLFTLPPTSPEVNRRLRQEARDERSLQGPPKSHDGRSIQPVPKEDEAGDEAPPVGSKELSRRMQEIRAALRTIKILGQILRNAASSKEGEDKLAIMQEVLLVGKRVLGYIFSHLKHLDALMEDVQDRCLEVMTEIRSEDDKPITDAERSTISTDAKSFATRFWFDMYWLATLSVISRLAGSVGSRDLEATIARVRKLQDDIPNHLVDLSSRLNRREKYIPKDEIIDLHEKLKRADNKLARVVLEAMLNERLTLFDTNHAARDAVCQQMNIKVPARALDLSSRKFLPANKAD